MNKQYLGDAVYIQFDGWNIILTTEDGISETNSIYMEPEVVAAFGRYMVELREQTRAAQTAGPPSLEEIKAEANAAAARTVERILAEGGEPMIVVVPAVENPNG